MKIAVFALAVVLAMLAPNAQAATYSITSGNAVILDGVGTITLSLQMDAVPGPNIPNPNYPFSGYLLVATYWSGVFQAIVSNSGRVTNAGAQPLGHCYTTCGYWPYSNTGASLSFNILFSNTTVSWSVLLDSSSNMISLNPHVTLSLSDGLTLRAVPIPAALPLFAAGLGIMGLLGWRKKRNGSPPSIAYHHGEPGRAA
jgi:hypothetical protein